MALTPENRLKLENNVQTAIFILMADSGVVTDIQDFIVRCAPIVRALLDGEIHVGEVDWMEKRAIARELMRGDQESP